MTRISGVWGEASPAVDEHLVTWNRGDDYWQLEIGHPMGVTPGAAPQMSSS